MKQNIICYKCGHRMRRSAPSGRFRKWDPGDYGRGGVETSKPCPNCGSYAVGLRRPSAWERLKPVLVDVLKPYPEALRAVRKALKDAV